MQIEPVPATPVFGFDETTTFVQLVFASLVRSDQRRWAEVYLRGLLSKLEKKSVRGIAQHVLRLPVGQSLQQFVNRSPWAWDPVREALACWVSDRLPVHAWVLDRVVVPKSGRHSVGVDRRYVESERRLVNCQVGIALSVSGPGHSVPVDWRLVLGPSWDADRRRRSATSVPEQEQSRPEWAYMLDLVDHVAGWGVPRRPVVVDATELVGAAELVLGLSERDVDWVVRIDDGFELGRPVGAGRADAGALRNSAGDHAAAMSRGAARATVALAGDGPSPAQVVLSSSVRLPSSRGSTVQLAVALPVAGDGRRALFLTNLPHARVREAVELARRAGHRTRTELRRLRDEGGIADFEGRSFRGWHHHMTLVSAAAGLAAAADPVPVPVR